MKIKITLFFLFISGIALSQTNDIGTWHIVNAQFNFNKKWQAFAELQLRSQLFFDNFFYYETKAGIGYNINKNFSVLAGTGRYTTYSNDGNFQKPFANRELRVWQQLIMNNYVDRLKFEHRYRAEQRWLTNEYRNRFRYRLNAVLPLNNGKLIKHTFYLTAFDEVFLNNKAPHFERNRLFGGAGYMFNPLLTLQAGYLHQYDYATAGNSHKNFLQFSLFLVFNNGQQEMPERIPQTID